MSNATTEKKAYKVLKVFAIIFILVGIAFFIYGIYATIQFALESAKDYTLFPSDPDEFLDDDNPIFGGKSGMMNFGGYIGSVKYALIGLGCIIIGIIFMFFYKRQKFLHTKSSVTYTSDYSMSPSQGETSETETAPVVEPDKPKHKIFCAYCGCELDENDKKCPNCGASKKFKK